jgi:hypothetical protein
VDPVDGQHRPVAAVAEPAGLLGHGGGDLDPRRLPDRADQDASSYGRRPQRGGGRAGRQQGAEDEHAGHDPVAATVAKAGRDARPQARRRQAERHGDPDHRHGEPGPEHDPGGGGRRQRHPIHVRVGVGRPT